MPFSAHYAIFDHNPNPKVMVRFLISCSFLFLFSVNTVFGQQAQPQQSLTLMFIGDVMGHDPQIKAAFDEETGHYNYDDVFARVSPIFKRADLIIEKLVVTLEGHPYQCYQKFSYPDDLID